MFPLLHNKQSSTFIQDMSENPAKAVYLIFPILAALLNAAVLVLQIVMNKQSENKHNAQFSIQQPIKLKVYLPLQTVISLPLIILLGFLSSFSNRQQRIMLFFPVQIMTLGVLVPIIIIKRDPQMVKFFFETVTNPLVDKIGKIKSKYFANAVHPDERRSGLTVY